MEDDDDIRQGPMFEFGANNATLFGGRTACSLGCCHSMGSSWRWGFSFFSVPIDESMAHSLKLFKPAPDAAQTSDVILPTEAAGKDAQNEEDEGDSGRVAAAQMLPTDKKDDEETLHSADTAYVTDMTLASNEEEEETFDSAAETGQEEEDLASNEMEEMFDSAAETGQEEEDLACNEEEEMFDSAAETGQEEEDLDDKQILERVVTEMLKRSNYEEYLKKVKGEMEQKEWEEKRREAKEKLKKKRDVTKNEKLEKQKKKQGKRKGKEREKETERSRTENPSLG